MIPNILIPRFYKWIGLLIYAAGMVFAINYPYDPDNVNYPAGLFLQIAILLGLLLMISARLNVEDEMTQHIRLVSLQWAILIYILIRVIYKIIAFYALDMTWLPRHQVNFLLLIYLCLFYSQVYFLPWIFSKFSRDEE
jgi:hypothetical protein